MITIYTAMEVPEITQQRIVLEHLQVRWGELKNVSALVALCCLAKYTGGPVFEFGTFRGRTAYNIALNAQCAVYTIDNLADRVSFSEYAPNELVPQMHWIHSIQADSTTHDLSRFREWFGLVFIDGGHDEATVRSDTRNAFRMIRKDGLVVWDDFEPNWPGVQRVVHEADCSYPLIHFVHENLVLGGFAGNALVKSIYAHHPTARRSVA